MKSSNTFSASHRFAVYFAALNGDKIYDFIVVFSMKVNRFSSTLNPFVIFFSFH
jgi:hypothetical protein